MPDLDLYRHIADVLLKEHETSTPPAESSGYPERLLGCIWGLYAQIHRYGRAAVMLIDNGMGQEAIVLTRSMLEYTVMLHWIVERGDSGVDAFLASQQRKITAWLHHADGTSLTIPPDLRQELTSGEPGIDEKKTAGAFEKVCREIRAGDLYAVYAFECLFVHPSVSTSNAYCKTSPVGDHRLTLEPVSGDHSSYIALIAHCLIWAGRDFDRITPGQPRAEGLERLAQEVEARPVLPEYRPVPPAARRPGTRKRRNTRKQIG
jgi:hypothetical protein